jgi:hypothetical protein
VLRFRTGQATEQLRLCAWRASDATRLATVLEGNADQLSQWIPEVAVLAGGVR